MEGLDDVFDDDLGLDEPIVETPEPNAEPAISEEDTPLFTEDKSPIVEELLKAKGIEGSKITILDEEEKETEVSFYDLPIEEQLEILNTQEDKQPVVQAIGETEQEFLNGLKEQNQTVEQYLEEYKKNILAEAEIPAESAYDIDSYNDKELFLLDLKAKYDLSDEELEKELGRALEDEELFTKKISKTREEYKQLEDQYKEEQAATATQQQQEQYNEFSNTMVDVAVNNSEYHGIEIEDSEKNEVLSDLLELDENGVSPFYKDLSDPNKLFEIAWFRRYGKEAFEAITNAYEAEIAQLKKDSKKPPVVIKRNNNKDRELTIDDLDIFK